MASTAVYVGGQPHLPYTKFRDGTRTVVVYHHGEIVLFRGLASLTDVTAEVFPDEEISATPENLIRAFEWLKDA